MKKLFYSVCQSLILIIVIGTNILSQPTPMIVDNIGDASDNNFADGVCATANNNCTLRAAMEQANWNAGPDIIHFNISGGGIHTITPATQLPILTDNAGVTIDGSTQPGASIGTNPPSTLNLLIEVKGQGYTILPPPPPPLMHGIWIMSDSNDIRGIVVNEFTGDGIRIEGTPDTSNHNLIYANIVGSDPGGGIDRGNATLSAPTPWYAGISIIVPPCEEIPVFTRNNIVRRNLVSGNGTFPPPTVNRGDGVSITNCPPGDNGFNTVEYNYIGTNKAGTGPLGNDSDGVTIAESAHDNSIDNNVISSNGYSGVGINGLSSPQRFTIKNTVSNNIIGLDWTATNPLGNGFQGVSIGRFGPNVWGFAHSNTINNNTIAHNSMNGVLIEEHFSTNNNGDNNLISQNSIYANGQLGIDLVTIPAPPGTVTLNDPGDLDSGPNEELNFPIISSAIIGGSNTTTISGTVTLPSPSTSLVEVFKAATDPSGYGEGMTYISSATPNAAGNWTLTTSVPINTSDMLTATSTDAANNTSEFSPNLTPVLPVELIAWEALLIESTVILTWSTASEINNKGFHIQKSYDGRLWKDLYYMPGIGASSVLNSYYYKDHMPFIGDNYYRLMQVDLNGQYEYSEVRHIFYAPDMAHFIRIHPNPSSGRFEVQILNADQLPLSVRIYDILGRMHWSLNLESGDIPNNWKKTFELPVQQVYILQVRMGKMLMNKKVVVTN